MTKKIENFEKINNKKSHWNRVPVPGGRALGRAQQQVPDRVHSFYNNKKTTLCLLTRFYITLTLFKVFWNNVNVIHPPRLSNNKGKKTIARGRTEVRERARWR